MRPTRFFPALLAISLMCLVACRMNGTTRRKVSKVTATTFGFIGKVVDDSLEPDQSDPKQWRFLEQQREWKQYWRENPNENRAMYEEFKDDYD